jgi:hypothetical protein
VYIIEDEHRGITQTPLCMIKNKAFLLQFLFFIIQSGVWAARGIAAMLSLDN